MKDGALRLLEEDARLRAAGQEGIAKADRGEFIEEEEINAPLLDAHPLDTLAAADLEHIIEYPKEHPKNAS